MHMKTAASLMLAALLIGAAGVTTADENTQEVDYVGSNTGVGAAFCGLTGEAVASACFEVKGTQSVEITIDDLVSGGNVWISGRALAESGNVDIAGGCGQISAENLPSDAHTIYVWIYGGVETSSSCEPGAGGVMGTVTATFS